MGTSKHTVMDAPNVSIRVNGRTFHVPRGTTAAAALLNLGIFTFERSVTGQRRAPLCGMGICFQCRATVNGKSGVRTCQLLCQEGMTVETAGEEP